MTDQPDRCPLVSVIMANYNGARFLAEAVRTVQAQTLADLEIIVADDGSTDGSLAVADELARGDRRVRVLRAPANGGPAAARNRALTVARGEWIAVVDADDRIHPRRLETLLAHARRDDADIVADDLLLFDDDAREPARALFRGDWARAPHWIDAATYIRSNVIFGRLPALGYCKPVLRRSVLGEARYDERLVIGEDSDLIARLLVGGARMRIYPELTYFYRRHSASVSHRITEAQCAAIEEAEDRFRALVPPGNAPVHAASRLRAASARRTLHYERLVAALKARSPGGVVRTLAASPSSALLLKDIVRRRLASLLPRRRSAAVEPGRNLLVLSRQRLEGATNGSSAYLLSIVAYLRQQGIVPHFRSPSPTTFGRTPFIRLGAAAEVFASFEVRGGTRIGNVIVTTDPRVLLRMVLGVLDLVLFKLRVTRRLLSPRAPYAVAAPLTRDDRLFVAAQGAGLADHVLFDYAYLTETRPYLAGKEGRTLVLMHDLVSSRQQRFARIGQADSISHLAFDEEAGRLGEADAVIAIQAQEAADLVAGGLGRPVIVAPMAAPVVPEPHPGRGQSILFVGSSAAPNRDGLQWFCDEVLPLVRQRCPAATLQVAGSVTRDLQGPPPGASFLGVVPDLAPLYREAAVVISPLRVGSGLKIKLIEALSWGKAIVATSTTVEGVEREVAGCVRVHDDAAGFAEAVVALLTNEAARTRLAAAAHAAARAAFSSEACYGPILRALAPDDAAPSPAARRAAV